MNLFLFQEKLKQFQERFVEERKQRLEDRKKQRKEDRRKTYYRDKEEEEQRLHEEQLKRGALWQTLMCYPSQNSRDMCENLHHDLEFYANGINEKIWGIACQIFIDLCEFDACMSCMVTYSLL